jgi:hypothetical protein
MSALQNWLQAANVQERARLAKAADTSVNYLYQMAGGHRKINAPIAILLERGAVPIKYKNKHLPDLYREDLTEACGDCEFAKKCRAK